jgi:Uma2 family endonuclease
MRREEVAVESSIAEPRRHLWTRDEYDQMADLGWFDGQQVEWLAGEVVVHPGPDAEPAAHEKLPLRPWTRDEYFQMIDLGWFRDQRVELMNGEVIEMPAQFNTHAASITLTEDALRLAFGAGYWIRVQMTLDLSPHGVPDPDIAVIVGSPRGATRNNPTSALLVVEVAESTLGYDRNAKASLYAAAGISDYWIVNLVQRQLEVYRDPVADASQPYGFRYASRIILDPGDVVTALAATGAGIAVADLLP